MQESSMQALGANSPHFAPQHIFVACDVSTGWISVKVGVLGVFCPRYCISCICGAIEIHHDLCGYFPLIYEFPIKRNE